MFQVGMVNSITRIFYVSNWLFDRRADQQSITNTKYWVTNGKIETSRRQKAWSKFQKYKKDQITWNRKRSEKSENIDGFSILLHIPKPKPGWTGRCIVGWTYSIQKPMYIRWDWLNPIENEPDFPFMCHKVEEFMWKFTTIIYMVDAWKKHQFVHVVIH